ncbi:hypothetical protein ACTAQI_02575 [Pseudarthrobacter sp. alpha12b]
MEMTSSGAPAPQGRGHQQPGHGQSKTQSKTTSSGPAQPGSLPQGLGTGVPSGDPDAGGGLLRAMSPGVVDYLFRQLVSGRPAEDVAWEREGISLAAQPEGAELARRLAETDIDALTPTELFHYVRAAQRLASWAEGLRQSAVGRYCHAGADAPQPRPHRI